MALKVEKKYYPEKLGRVKKRVADLRAGVC
jgi:hypothetical protein